MLAHRAQLHNREKRWVLIRFYWHGILFEEPNPTGSRPRDQLDLIGLYERQKKPYLHGAFI